MSEYLYLGKWDGDGVPDYLDSIENIDPVFLNRIRKSLPEKGNVINHSPDYLENTASRNIIIRSTNPEFTGADVHVTFITEGAGYKNVVGYYWYPLQTGFDVPTKLDNSSYIPLTYNEKDDLDGNGKSILNKTIIFPNASLKGKGGKLLSGSRVKLLYDVNNPDVKWPNNIGIGFFLIPNGWNNNTSNFTNKPNVVYSDHEFNLHDSEDKGYVQVIMLNDLESNGDEKRFVLGFEDIMRPGGDKDFNDLIIKIDIDPGTSYDIVGGLFLGNSEPYTENKVIADPSGLYIHIVDKSILSLLDDNSEIFTLIQTINIESETELDLIKDIFDYMVFEFSPTITKIDEKTIDIIFKIPRGNITNFIYLMYPANNADIKSKNYEGINNIAIYQNNYIFSSFIVSDTYRFYNDGGSLLLTLDGKPDVTRITTPTAMGDPHIVTLKGEKYMLPNQQKYVELYNIDSLLITGYCDYFPGNEKYELYKDLTFLKYMYINNNGKNVVLDMYTPGVFYEITNKELKKIDNIPKEFELIDPMIVGKQDIEKNIPIKFYRSQCIKFINKDLGEVIMKINYVTRVRDYINDFTIISKNMGFQRAIGALANMHTVSYPEFFE